MKVKADKARIADERTAKRKATKQRRKAEAQAKRREAICKHWNIPLDSFSRKAKPIKAGSDIKAGSEEIVADDEERTFAAQCDELAAKIKAQIEADRVAGREVDLWEYLKGAPCAVTKALRKRGIFFGKRKR